MTGNANGAAIQAKIVSTRPRTRDERLFAVQRSAAARRAQRQREHRQPGGQVAAAQQEQHERGARKDDRLQDVAEVRACPAAAGCRRSTPPDARRSRAIRRQARNAPSDRSAGAEPVHLPPDVEPRFGVSPPTSRERSTDAAGLAAQFEQSIAGRDALARAAGLPGATDSTVAAEPTRL